MPCRRVSAGKALFEVQIHPTGKGDMTMKSTFRIAVLAAAAAVAVPGFAQQPNPLDNVPDKMPFDTPYGAPIPLDRAEAAIAAAVAEAKKRDWKMNVSVVDSGGNLVAFQRMD